MWTESKQKVFYFFHNGGHCSRMKTVTLSIRVDPQLVEGLQEFEIKTGIERASLVRESVFELFRQAIGK